jgi:hypothetical protein
MMRAVAAVACAVALGGCAEDEAGGALSKSEYEERFREVIREAEESAPAPAPGSQTPQEQAEEIDTGLDRIRSTASELAELEPPADIAPAHAMFVDGLRGVADDAEKLVSALRAGDEARADAMLDRGTIASPATARKIGRARREFADKGYDLGGVSEFP